MELPHPAGIEAAAQLGGDGGRNELARGRMFVGGFLLFAARELPLSSFLSSFSSLSFLLWPWRGFTVKSGQEACRTTYSAMLPRVR